MARIRTIKPEFFKSEDVSALPLRARLTWVGLWVHCDNYGRTKDHAKLIKADVWPLDPVSLADIEDDLTVLAEHGRIVRYEVDGRRYLAVVNWDRHQPIARPGLPKYPAPPLAVENVSRHDSDASLNGRDKSSLNREQGTGNREGDARANDETHPESVHSEEPPPVENHAREPPRRCRRHLDDPDPPNCGQCADARRLHQAWEAGQAQRRVDADRQRQQHPRCRTCGQRHPPDHCPAT